MNLASLVRDNIQKLKPFSAARAEFEGHADIYLDANENPYNTGFNRYPDPYQWTLKKQIANWKHISIDQIFLGNGSDEIIDLLIRVFCRPGVDRIRYLNPSFGMYEVCADINNVAKWPIALGADFELDADDCTEQQEDRDKLLFLCSPNNPTGQSLDQGEIIKIIQNWKSIVVIDEAYIDFSDDPSFIDRLAQYPNLVILQTFSKALGGAGLRIGMAFASAEIIVYLNKVKPPYNIGQSTQENAQLILADLNGYLEKIRALRRARVQLQNDLLTIPHVIKIFPSDANFLLVKFKEHLDILQYLREHGIIVRDRSKLLGCEQCLRITIGTKEENEKLMEVLERCNHSEKT